MHPSPRRLRRRLLSGSGTAIYEEIAPALDTSVLELAPLLDKLTRLSSPAAKRTLLEKSIEQIRADNEAFEQFDPAPVLKIEDDGPLVTIDNRKGGRQSARSAQRAMGMPAVT